MRLATPTIGSSSKQRNEPGSFNSPNEIYDYHAKVEWGSIDHTTTIERALGHGEWDISASFRFMKGGDLGAGSTGVYTSCGARSNPKRRVPLQPLLRLSRWKAQSKIGHSISFLPGLPRESPLLPSFPVFIRSIRIIYYRSFLQRLQNLKIDEKGKEKG